MDGYEAQFDRLQHLEKVHGVEEHILGELFFQDAEEEYHELMFPDCEFYMLGVFHWKAPYYGIWDFAKVETPDLRPIPVNPRLVEMTASGALMGPKNSVEFLLDFGGDRREPEKICECDDWDSWLCPFAGICSK